MYVASFPSHFWQDSHLQVDLISLLHCRSYDVAIAHMYIAVTMFKQYIVLPLYFMQYFVKLQTHTWILLHWNEHFVPGWHYFDKWQNSSCFGQVSCRLIFSETLTYVVTSVVVTVSDFFHTFNIVMMLHQVKK